MRVLAVSISNGTTTSYCKINLSNNFLFPLMSCRSISPLMFHSSVFIEPVVVPSTVSHTPTTGISDVLHLNMRGL